MEGWKKKKELFEERITTFRLKNVQKHYVGQKTTMLCETWLRACFPSVEGRAADQSWWEDEHS